MKQPANSYSKLVFNKEKFKEFVYQHGINISDFTRQTVKRIDFIQEKEPFNPNIIHAQLISALIHNKKYFKVTEKLNFTLEKAWDLPAGYLIKKEGE